MDPVAFTAHWVAAARARASRGPDALFHDPFAAVLAGEEGERWMEDDDDDDLVVAYIALRTRFFDEELLRAATDGVRQIVILAAGLDARAFRIDWPAGTHVFEIDRPEMITHKDEILRAAGAKPRCGRTTLGGDLTEPFAESLRAAGFVAEVRSAWLVEGLLPYLHANDVTRLLAQVSVSTARGSALAFDVVGVDALSAPRFATQAEKLIARGIRMPFSCGDPVGLLAPFGFAGCRSSFREVADRLGRAVPMGDTAAGDPLEGQLVTALRR